MQLRVEPNEWAAKLFALHWPLLQAQLLSCTIAWQVTNNIAWPCWQQCKSCKINKNCVTSYGWRASLQELRFVSYIGSTVCALQVRAGAEWLRYQLQWVHQSLVPISQCKIINSIFRAHKEPMSYLLRGNFSNAFPVTHQRDCTVTFVSDPLQH